MPGLAEAARVANMRRVVGALRGILIVLLMGGAGLVALTYRLTSEGLRQMAESDVHFNAGHLEDSLVFARKAADLYVPMATHVRLADERLYAIASGAEAHRLRTVALLAWQAIRASESKRPGWAGRNSSRLRIANQRIGELLAGDGSESDDNRAGADPTRNLSSDLGQQASGKLTDLGQVASLGTLFLGGAAMVLGRRRNSPGKRPLLALIGAVLLAVGATSWTFFLAFA